MKTKKLFEQRDGPERASAPAGRIWWNQGISFSFGMSVRSSCVLCSRSGAWGGGECLCLVLWHTRPFGLYSASDLSIQGQSISLIDGQAALRRGTTSTVNHPLPDLLSLLPPACDFSPLSLLLGWVSICTPQGRRIGIFEPQKKQLKGGECEYLSDWKDCLNEGESDRDEQRRKQQEKRWFERKRERQE